MLRVIRKPIQSSLEWIRWLRCRLRGTGTCDLRFTLQGRYPSVVNLAAFGIKNAAVTIHGSALLAGSDVTEDEFISVRKEQVIIDALNGYLTRNALNPGRNHLLILDLEPK